MMPESGEREYKTCFVCRQSEPHYRIWGSQMKVVKAPMKQTERGMAHFDCLPS